ncbi:spore germination protein GerPE [Mesobacillus zeae]|uniref:Spore germination protein GerPE n=1 Tax=Mesobacillus zeae TaxID=1917180 RepID=A0A398B9L8_9BACI|nr:spore germination protein GerPE [Mesobacillus zeae]RID84590.1 spore germination protein GerPE [Mesobacillus zeae]
MRTSAVENIRVSSLIFSSVLEIGDTTLIEGCSRVLAVQREGETFFGNEGDFLSFKVFTEPIPLAALTEKAAFSKNDLCSFIHVGAINVIGISTSSVMQIGNAGSIQMEARVKHIRQLLPR